MSKSNKNNRKWVKKPKPNRNNINTGNTLNRKDVNLVNKLKKIKQNKGGKISQKSNRKRSRYVKKNHKKSNNKDIILIDPWKTQQNGEVTQANLYIPIEIISEILSFIDSLDKIIFSSTCKLYYKKIGDIIPELYINVTLPTKQRLYLMYNYLTNDQINE